MYVNDLEQELGNNGVNGIDISMVKLILFLYADDIVLFGKTSDELLISTKTKVVIFRKRGRLPIILQFTYKGSTIESVNKLCYLGIVFTSGGSPFETQKAVKAIFTLNKYLNSFTVQFVTVSLFNLSLFQFVK